MSEDEENMSEEEETFPKVLRETICDGWWLHPDWYTRVVEFANEEEDFYLYLRVRDLFDVENIEELERMIEDDPHHYFMLYYCDYEHIQRALKEVLPEGVRYEPSDQDPDVWVLVDNGGEQTK